MATRTLHWCFKIGKRAVSINFYRELLGMKILRHEEFDRGCEATCNGPYDNRWSKTMVGYGPEDSNFVLELTYNYPIQSYTHGNGFQYFVLESSEAIKNLEKVNYPKKKVDDYYIVNDPDGYQFHLKEGENKFKLLRLNVSSLEKSLNYWVDTLAMQSYQSSLPNSALFAFGADHCKLELIEINEKIDHKTASGRIAFSRPIEDVKKLSKRIEELNYPILHNYRELGTPGKATVAVVIFLDPDGYEICFVGDENYTLLCTVDPKADELLEKALEEDKSDEWYQKKKGNKLES